MTFKPVATPVAPALTDAQQEERYWDDAKVTGNKEAFDAYLQLYPRGRYSGLAKANVERLGAKAVSANPALIRAPDAEGSPRQSSGPSATGGGSGPRLSPT